MAVRNHFHNAKAGVESPVTKKLSGIRLLFADLKFMRRTHYIMQFYRIHLCVLLTKQDFHFTNMHLAYKTGFSFYKYASRLQSVAFRFTNGTLGLQFISVTCMLTPEKNNVNKFLSFIDKNLLTLVIVLCVM